ncbi:IS30 family transposase [Fundicoccus ignavus]|uniref:IS30 family transposase n=1 Tax=Fundicoccus ignavus TaxID=2664442 RepID=A0A844BZ23_9LACT|nr:IS30 family transposase [Fundicoccus ignavus]MRJ46162.1 IS30 family transposase [Fundicoccus ignavus]
MNQHKFTNITRKKKEKHLKFEDRIKIENLEKAKRLLPKKKQMTRKEMAEIIGCGVSSLYRELSRGKVILKDSEWKDYVSYSAVVAQEDYDRQATNKGPEIKLQDDYKFVNHVEAKILKDKWSPDAIIMDLEKNGNPFETEISTRTLYYYIENEFFLNVTITDLPRRGELKKRKKRNVQPRQKVPFGKDITHRPEEVDSRMKFGHWEMDTVESGKKTGTACLLTLIERKYRLTLIFKLRAQTQKEVKRVLDSLEKELGTDDFSQTFKTITVDNGSEFLNSEALEKSIEESDDPRTNIYYCHPYASYERGSNEQMHTLIRRFIPKGSAISKYTKGRVYEIQNWINNYPRRILKSHTSMQLLIREYIPNIQQIFQECA